MFGAFVRENPIKTDYAISADYRMDPRGAGVWAVHSVVCDRSAQSVIVDFRNDHHQGFQSVKPKTAEDCGRPVARRLTGYLR